MIKVAIIGFGYSGKRFYEILKVRQKKQNDIKIVGICDNNPNALTGLNDIFTCTKVEKLFMISKDIDIIIIAVNEKYRFEIFKEVLKYKNKFKIIISEKLLTENVEQAEKVLEMYQNFGVFVHFVERFSPVVSDFQKWKKVNHLTVRRANFFWGKNRLYDKRPTIGVISEISHPLDLVLYLSDATYNEKFEIESGNYVFSNYSLYDIDLLETINVSIKTDNNLFIFGNSSFLWNKRDRRISLFLSNGQDDDIKYIANFTFDYPSWDNDKCEIFKVDKLEKNIYKIKEYISTANKDELKGLKKMYSFLEKVIEQLYEHKTEKKELPDLKSSVYIQNIVDEILKEAKTLGYHF